MLDRNPANPDALFGYLRAAMASGNPLAIETAQQQLEQVYRNAGAASQLAVAQAQLADASAHSGGSSPTPLNGRSTPIRPCPKLQGTAFLIGHHLGNFRQYFSQFGQDRYLDQNVFANKREGVFVDVGAYDGFSGSNTLFFEKFMGWTGLCIEPDPAQFAKIPAYRACDRVASLHCRQGRYGAVLQHHPTASTMMGGLVDYFEPQDMKMISERSKTKVIELPTRRLEVVPE